VVVDPLDNVTINGLTISDFPGSGIFFFGAHNPKVIGVRALGNEEYRIPRFTSTGGKIVDSVAKDSDEAGIYVGDSPNANVLLAANEVSDNLLASSSATPRTASSSATVPTTTASACST
jgi:hypothetical protein